MGTLSNLIGNGALLTGVLIVGMLITGTLNTIAAKVQNDTKSINFDGMLTKFSHPWVQTWFMFLGECLCLVALGVIRIRERCKLQIDYDADPSAPHPHSCSPVFFLPTMCDLVSSSLGGIGLLYVPASIWQMLRGARIPISGVMSVVFLKRRLYAHHWLGIFILLVGLGLVAIAGFFMDSHSTTTETGLLILGISLTIGAQVISSAQMIVEETFVRGRNFHVLAVAGMEGLFGIVIMGLFVLPAMYFVKGNGLIASVFAENSLDAIVQIRNSGMLQLFMALYVCSIAFFNFFGLMLTKKLSAVHRMLMDTLRTVTIWGVEVIIYYATHDTSYGEPLSVWSIAQLGGFLLLILGTLLYNEVIRIPWSYYPPPSREELESLVNDKQSSGQ